MSDQSSQLADGKNHCPKARRKFVNIGSMTGRWMKIKLKKCCKSDEDLARLLIKSLHQLDQQSRYGGHISRYWKRRNIPKHGSHRIIALQTDVWAHWRELKHSLKINSNSQLADVLMNAWHDRADYIQKLCDAYKASQQAPINETQVMEVMKKEAGVAEAPSNESMNQHLAEDAPVNVAALNETFRNKYLVDDVLVNKSSRNKYLLEDAFVNETFRNRYLVEDTSLNEAPDPMNEVMVKVEIMSDQSEMISREVSPEFTCQSEKEDCNSEESDADTEIEDFMNYLEAEKKMIKISEDPSEDNAELGNRRKSSRVQSRGYRPDYASLEWTDDCEKNSDDSYVSKNVVTMCEKQDNVRRKPTETAVTEDDKLIDKTKKINKRKVNEDSDFFPGGIEDLDKGGNSTETNEDKGYTLKNEGDSLTDGKISNKDIEKKKRKIGKTVGKNCKKKRKQEDNADYEIEGDCLTGGKITNKDMVKRKRKTGKAVGKNCKKRRMQEDDAEYEIKKKPKAKKDKKSDQHLDKKSWIHIKLEEHQDKYSKEIVKSFARKDRNVDLTEELFKCLICGNFKSTARDLFEAHIEKHVNKVLECDKCSYVGYSELVLLKHKFSVGHVSGKNQFMCDICGLVLYTSDARLSHIGKEHGDPQFQCRFCDEKFATNSGRKKHYRTVHTDLVKYCFNCQLVYGHLSLEDFKDHQCSCKATNQCQVCGTLLASKSGLNKHLASTHMNVRNYQCSTCPYSAKNSQRLREHELSHRSDHPFFCDKCTFSCVQRYQLKSHMRTHTGEKPYKCSQCKFAAAWNVQLKEHVKVHGMENTVACSHCDIVFRNQKALKMHEKKDHPDILGIKK
ncbi:zinc finger protein 37 homolog [Ruditapes philippinarum]|uniref:zinc finger protein 37 homolog n=1 Tax=Ruditapes philippinarum TaxID=129788 RepID=UPI00295A77BB|nr:zinc finger protein 37 homolog [Ruditapes philippinarum]